jgi:urea carboxylase
MDRLQDGSRYSYGADEFVFVELSEEMSLETTLRVIAITDQLRQLAVPGVLDICPAHVSYMVRVDPEVLDPRQLVPLLAGLHDRGSSTQLAISARLIELPVYYDVQLMGVSLL